MTLPKGWAEATVDDLGEYLNGMAFKPTDWRNEGIGIIRIQNLTDETKPLNKTNRSFDPRYRVRRGDLLVSWSATLDAFIWNREDAVLNQHIFKVTPSECVDKDFLFYQLRELIAEMAVSGHLHGSTMKHINRGPFLAHAAVLPPLAEQRRIVVKLDALTARLARARAEVDRVMVLANGVRRSVLVRTFGLEPQEDWVKLGLLLEHIHAGKNLKCEERPPSSDEKGVVKVSAVSGEAFLPLQSKTLPLGYTPPEHDRIVAGDLLLARASGSLGLVGRVVLVVADPHNLYLSDKVLRLQVRDGLQNWVYWFLKSPAGRRQIEDCASGISMHNITQPSLRLLRLPRPDSSLLTARLAAISAAFARAERLEAEAARARALIDRLEAAILARAFRGELVPQDPDDEPASVLLERVRAQRAAAPKPKRGRKKEVTINA